MKTSQIGVKLIKEFESLHDGDLKTIGLQPKMDPIGIWTEGYGRAMRDSKGNFIKGISNKKLAYDSITIHNIKEAEEALFEDLTPRELAVFRKLKIKVNQNQFDALVSHYYNTGGSATLFDLINKKASNEQIKNWFTTRYITGDGKPLAGLVRRRKAEWDLFNSK
jgi:lysozyme